jgi:hypothetical protein
MVRAQPLGPKVRPIRQTAAMDGTVLAFPGVSTLVIVAVALGGWPAFGPA